MYSRNTWGGDVDPFIEIVFLNDTVKEGTDPIVSLVIFEWKDFDLVGIPDGEFMVRGKPTHDISPEIRAEIRAEIATERTGLTG
jgi:hypothetical protein